MIVFEADHPSFRRHLILHFAIQVVDVELHFVQKVWIRFEKITEFELGRKLAIILH